MWLYGLTGLIAGFVIGMAINAYLLRDIPKQKWLTDRKLKTRFGLLNWGMAFFGMIIALALAGR